MRRPHSVQVFLIRSVGSQRSYLLFQRNARPELGLPDFWQGVSGALELGETFGDAALREVAEETGLVLASVADTGFQHAYPIRPEWRHYEPHATEVVERVFVAHVPPSSEPILSAEHQSWRWCLSSEAKALLTFGANAQCWQAVERWLSEKSDLSLHAPEQELSNVAK
jgi:8-oxo-dGTP pyrophosphatase MutT (NUDIX family)